MNDEEQTDYSEEDDAPKRRTALTRAEVWENAFTAWWIRYLKRRFGVGPNYRHMDPYAEAESAAADAAAWARKRTGREQRATTNETGKKCLIERLQRVVTSCNEEVAHLSSAAPGYVSHEVRNKLRTRADAFADVIRIVEEQL